MSRKRGKRKLPVTMEDSVVKEIISELIVNNNKRQVANNFKVDIGKIYQIYNANAAYILNEREKLRIKEEVPQELNEKSVETIQLEMEAEEKKEQEEVPEPPKAKKRKLTEEETLEIINAVKTKEFTRKQIAEICGIGYSTVNRVIRAAIEEGTITATDIVTSKRGRKSTKASEVTTIKAAVTKKSKPEPEEHEEIVNIDDGELQTIPIVEEIPIERDIVLNYVKMGMVSDRHNMPTDSYIFETMDDDLMFDYEQQYKIAQFKIKSAIEFDSNGKAKNGLAVYVTGLTCALATIIRVCMDLKVNLTLLHYNNKSKIYCEQPIITQYLKDTSAQLPASLQSVKCRNMYTVGCTINDLDANEEVYEICEAFFIGQEPDRKTYRDITLFTDKMTAWQYYANMVERNNARPAEKRANIYFNRVNTMYDTYYKTGAISKSVVV